MNFKNIGKLGSYAAISLFAAYIGTVARPTIDAKSCGYSLKQEGSISDKLNGQAKASIVTPSGLELEISEKPFGVMLGNKDYKDKVVMSYAGSELETPKLHCLVDNVLATKYTSEQLKTTIYQSLPRLVQEDRQEVRKTEILNVLEEMTRYVNPFSK